MNFNYLVRYDEFLFYPWRECQLAPDFRRVKKGPSTYVRYTLCYHFNFRGSSSGNSPWCSLGHLRPHLFTEGLIDTQLLTTLADVSIHSGPALTDQIGIGESLAPFL